MPAQKLTKARFAQILIMLSVLIGVFFWRTFTHESVNNIDSLKKERCDVTIEEEKNSINHDSQEISFETIKNCTQKVDLDQSSDVITLNKSNKK